MVLATNRKTQLNLARIGPTLPPGVHVKGSRYYLVKRVDGKKRWFGLSPVPDGLERMKESLAALQHGAVTTVSDLLESYLKAGTEDIRPVTKKGYELMCQSEAPLVWAFGRMKIGSLTTADVAKYLEKRKKAGRAHGGNRERAVLSAAGFHPDCLVFRDAREGNWHRGLKQTSAVVCDSLTAAQLPAGCRAIPFPLLSETSIHPARLNNRSSSDCPRRSHPQPLPPI